MSKVNARWLMLIVVITLDAKTTGRQEQIVLINGMSLSQTITSPLYRLCIQQRIVCNMAVQLEALSEL